MTEGIRSVLIECREHGEIELSDLEAQLLAENIMTKGICGRFAAGHFENILRLNSIQTFK